jgi:hypothetical protein
MTMTLMTLRRTRQGIGKLRPRRLLHLSVHRSKNLTKIPAGLGFSPSRALAFSMSC